jgi:hypothetical protein
MVLWIASFKMWTVGSGCTEYNTGSRGYEELHLRQTVAIPRSCALAVDGCVGFCSVAGGISEARIALCVRFSVNSGLLDFAQMRRVRDGSRGLQGGTHAGVGWHSGVPLGYIVHPRPNMDGWPWGPRTSPPALGARASPVHILKEAIRNVNVSVRMWTVGPGGTSQSCPHFERGNP